MKPLKYIDNPNRCGSCDNFCYLVKNGKLLYRGQCKIGKKYNYHQASQKACSKYRV